MPKKKKVKCPECGSEKCGEKYVADFRVYFKANGAMDLFQAGFIIENRIESLEPVHKGMLILNSLEKIQEFPE